MNLHISLKNKFGGLRMQRLACGAHLRLLGPGADCSLGPAKGTGVRPGSVPSNL